MHYNQVMRVRTHGDWPELQLSNGATATFDTSTLNSREAHDGADNTAFAGRILQFTYTFQAGDDISTLGLDGASPQINLNGAFIEHGYGLHQLNDGIGVDRDDPTSGSWDRTADLSLPAEGDENSLSAQMDISISTTPPATTITDTFYDSATGLLKINGSDFEGILVGSAMVETVGLKSVLDWGKLTYKVNGTDTLTFTEDDIADGRILDDGSILIQLSNVQMDAIAALTAGDVSDDRVDIGDDIFTIDHDDTSVTGGSGADVIHLNIPGSANDVADLIITDFHADEGDKLVLDDLMVNPGNSLDEYFHFTADGNDTVMEISPQAGGDVSQRVTFKDVNLFSLGSTDTDIINNLLSNGNIDHGE